MAQLTATQADKLNRMHPTMQEMSFGTAVYETSVYSPVIFKKDITGAANSTPLAAFTAPFAMQIVDIIVQATATVSNGTVTPKKGTDTICTAIACAADGAVTHMSAGTTAPARLILAAGDVVNLVTANANDRGIVTIIGIRL